MSTDKLYNPKIGDLFVSEKDELYRVIKIYDGFKQYTVILESQKLSVLRKITYYLCYSEFKAVIYSTQIETLYDYP